MYILILKNFLHRRLRSFLTVLGIVVGVTLILTLVFLGEGMKRAVTAQMQAFGSDLIYLFPGKEENALAGMFGPSELRDKDIRAIEEVKGVRTVLPMQTKMLNASFRGEEKAMIIHGSPWVETQTVFGESQGFKIEKGEWPARDEAQEVVVGFTFAKDRFEDEIRPGDVIEVRGKEFGVKGVLSQSGDAGADAMLYFSQIQFRRITGETGASYVAVKVEEGSDTNIVAEDIKDRLLDQRGVSDFVIITTEKAGEIIGDILGVIQLVLSGIAAVALLVGGVGIMNTMFTAVLERAREIGVLKALGATAFKIQSIFLLESGLLGLVGGTIGIIIAISVSKIIELIAISQGFILISINVDPATIIGVLLLALFFGLVAGFVPARQASKLRPTEALRYE